MAKLTNQRLLAVVLYLMVTAGTGNAATLTFIVVETAVPGTGLVPDFEAHKLNGGYGGTLTINPDATFNANAVAFFTGYFDEGDDPVGSGLAGCSFTDACYRLYAVLTSSGTVNPQTGVLTGTASDLTLYVDPSRSTSVNPAPTGGGTPSIIDPLGDDLLVLSSSDLAKGVGTIVPGVGGFFDLTLLNVGLSAFGQVYYPDLPLMNLAMIVDGDFDEIPIPLVPGTYAVSGDVSAVFSGDSSAGVPEPASMALFGLMFLGAGLAARRRRSP